MYNDIVFNDLDLTTLSNVSINEIKLDRTPQVLISQNKLARTDGAKLYNKEYGTKEILVEGLITCNDRNDFLVARNELLKALETEEATLQLPLYDTVEYTATVKNTIFSDTGGGFGRFSIEFTCSDPFGYDRDSRVILNADTTTSATDTFTLLEAIDGYYETPLQLTLSLISVTGGDTQTLTLTNQAGEYIAITRTWASDDVIVLDTKTKSCKINGNETDYAGEFWNLSIGDTSIDYEDTFTTRSVAVTATYKRRYL